MGCDIHLFVEYRKENWKEDYWKSFGSQFRLGRHYGVFSALADVRNYGDELKPVCEPRGIPKNIGTAARESYLYYVTDTPQDPNDITPETADRWTKGREYRKWDDTHVTDPDAHSESWLTADEFEKALDSQFNEDGIMRGFGETEDYKAVLAAMRSLESDPAIKSRIVFWFDN